MVSSTDGFIPCVKNDLGRYRNTEIVDLIINLEVFGCNLKRRT